MKHSWQKGASPFSFRLNTAKPPGLFSIFLIIMGLVVFLFFGIGILMLAATVAVLLLPWIWWKRRQLLKAMAQQRAYDTADGAVYRENNYRSEDAGPDSGSVQGIIIEGEVIDKTNPERIK